VLGVLGISLGAVFLWDMCQQKKLVIAGYACLVLYPTFPLLVTTIGLETPLYIAFCLGAIAIYERKNYSIAAVFSALAYLTRPDGILVPIILAAHYILTQRSFPPIKPVLIFSSFVLPWLFFTFLYFGTPVPVA
jgi:Gpi18-like mannosyltransferase